MVVRKYAEKDILKIVEIWNHVVEEGIAFPQEDLLTNLTGKDFFESQTFCGVAEDEESGDIVGLYILLPNSIDRCSHISNASYAVNPKVRGKHIGGKLVMHCIHQAYKEGFRILQFNAVVKINTHARHLYEKCGFTQLGTIPNGFRMKDGHYEDICPYFIEVF